MCNFRCGFCHNPEFVLPEKLKEILENLITEKAFFNFLNKRK
jgi:pyruvate-formate lyase-activating enzyme